MYLIREVFFCKPGKVRALLEKFTAMSRLGEKAGLPRMRLMTDMSAERYWMLVAEMEFSTLQAFEDAMANPQGSAEDQKELEGVMKDYHDLVESGRREIYRIEG